MEFRQDEASIPRLGGIVAMGVWFHGPKSGYETKRHALEVVLMRVPRLHLGEKGNEPRSGRIRPTVPLRGSCEAAGEIADLGLGRD